jgi:hypothetical protein
MKITAIEGDSLTHSAVRARSYANTYFDEMTESAALFALPGASATEIPTAIFDYFGVRVEITRGMAAEAIADAIRAVHGRRFLEYRKHLKRNAKVRVFEGIAGTDVLESAWTATQQAQAQVNLFLEKGTYELLRRCLFEFNGEAVEFNPYAAGHEIAESAMNQLRATALEHENTPKGREAKEKEDARQAKAKAKLDSYIGTLPAVLPKSLTDVLRWIEGYSKAYNINQREARAAKVLEEFQLGDYQAHAYVGEAAVPYILGDKSILGAYIVGQFMATLEAGGQMPDALEVLLAQYRAQA